MGELLEDKRWGSREVLSGKLKGMVVCRQIHGNKPIRELLMRREEINGEVKFLQRQKEMEPRE